MEIIEAFNYKLIIILNDDSAYIHVYVSMYVCEGMHECVYVFVCACVHMSTCKSACAYVHVLNAQMHSSCTHRYTCTSTHPHTLTHKP